VSNISFGLNRPRGRCSLGLPDECVQAGLTSAIVHASKILPMSKIPDEQRKSALDMIYDRRAPGYDPLQRFLGPVPRASTSRRCARPGPRSWRSCRLDERLERRIVDGERNGLEGRPGLGARIPVRG